MRQDKLLVQMTTAFTQADEEQTKKLLSQLMPMAYEGGIDFEDRADKILLAKSACEAVNKYDCSSQEKAHVYAYVLGIFYWDEGIRPYLVQLLPKQLHGWAYLGMRLGECSSQHLPEMMQHPTKDLFAKEDVHFLQHGDQLVKLQALLLLINETDFPADEFLEENTWLQVMGAYSANQSELPTDNSSLYTYMSSWFPQYETYLKHCAAMELMPADVLALMPTLEASMHVTMPVDIG